VKVAAVIAAMALASVAATAEVVIVLPNVLALQGVDMEPVACER
jgi:hypothetical protein